MGIAFRFNLITFDGQTRMFKLFFRVTMHPDENDSWGSRSVGGSNNNIGDWRKSLHSMAHSLLSNSGTEALPNDDSKEALLSAIKTHVDEAIALAGCESKSRGADGLEFAKKSLLLSILLSHATNVLQRRRNIPENEVDRQQYFAELEETSKRIVQQTIDTVFSRSQPNVGPANVYSAFAWCLLEDWRTDMENRAYLILYNWDDAADVVSKCIEKLAAGHNGFREKYRGESSFRHYVFKAVKHRCIDLKRKRERDEDKLRKSLDLSLIHI